MEASQKDLTFAYFKLRKSDRRIWSRRCTLLMALAVLVATRLAVADPLAQGLVLLCLALPLLPAWTTAGGGPC